MRVERPLFRTLTHDRLLGVRSAPLKLSPTTLASALAADNTVEHVCPGPPFLSLRLLERQVGDFDSPSVKLVILSEACGSL